MATPYEKIFKRFILSIKDTDLVQLSEEDIKELLMDWLDGSVSKFNYACKQDLLENKDDVLEQFNIDLTLEEIDILVLLMKVEWLSPNINNTSLMKQHLSSKDFNLFSPANQLNANSDLYRKAKKDADNAITLYSYMNMEKLKK